MRWLAGVQGRGWFLIARHGDKKGEKAMHGIFRSALHTVLLLALGAAAFGASIQQTRKVSVEALIYDLKHPDPERRKQAASVLGQNRIRAAVPALIELTEDPEPHIRLEAVRALVQINDRRALPAYIRLVGDSNKAVREKAVDGIIDAYVIEEDGFFQGVRKVADFVNPFSDDYNPQVVEPYVSVDPQAVTALSALLESEDGSSRRRAATALGILRARSALPAIHSRLETETDDGVKVELIRAVYKMGDPLAAKPLVPLVHDPDKKVHDEAIFTVGRLRVPEATPVLKQLYESGVEERKKIFKIVPVSGPDDLQKNVFQALAYIGDPSCKELFFNALTDDRAFYRRYGAEGLGRIGDPAVTTSLARAYLRETSDKAKLAMSFALYRLGREEHLDELAANADSDQGLNYLLEFQPAEIAKLYLYLGSETTPSLLEAIGLRGDDSALPVVEQLTSSSDQDVVAAANLAIRRLRARHSQL